MRTHLKDKTISLDWDHGRASFSEIGVIPVVATAPRSREAVVRTSVGVEPRAVAPGRRDRRQIIEGHPLGPFLVAEHVVPYSVHEEVWFYVMRGKP